PSGRGGASGRVGRPRGGAGVRRLRRAHGHEGEHLRQWPRRGPHDVLILAGDIAGPRGAASARWASRGPAPAEIRASRRVCFRAGRFCPVHRDDGCEDSVAKLGAIEQLCEELGVRTRPGLVGEVAIVPLLSWYHAGFDADPDVVDDSLAPVEQVMMDFHLCKWPEGLTPLGGSDSIARFMDGLNSGLPGRLWTLGLGRPTAATVSFSHFLPRAELLPEKRTLFYPHLSKAVGSLPLRDRVRALRPDLHVFGHTHYAWAAEVEGTRFLQACLAYPREREERPFSVKCGDGGGQASLYDIPLKGIKMAAVDDDSTAIQGMFESVAEWITNDIKASVCDTPPKDLDMVVAFASNVAKIQEMFELVADQIPNNIKASEYNIPLKDLDMVVALASNSTTIQETFELVADQVPNNTKAFVHNFPLQDPKMAAVDDSTAIHVMFESVAEWIPNNIQASFAGDSTTIQEMFKSMAKRIPNNIKASLCDTPLKDLKMAALAYGYTAIHEMFEGVAATFRRVAESIPNNIKASLYDIPVKDLRMAAFADNSTAIQEMLGHMVEWILINIKAFLCDIPLEGLEMAALANNSTAIQVMFKHVAEGISSISTAIQEMSESEAVRIPNNFKASVCDIPLRGLKVAAFAGDSTTIQDLKTVIAFAGNSTTILERSKLVAEWVPSNIKASVCDILLTDLKMVAVAGNPAATQEMFGRSAEWILNNIKASGYDIPLKDLKMVVAFAGDSSIIQERLRLVAEWVPNNLPGVSAVGVHACFQRPGGEDVYEEAMAELEGMACAFARSGLALSIHTRERFHRRRVVLCRGDCGDVELTLDLGLHIFAPPRRPAECAALELRKTKAQQVVVRHGRFPLGPPLGAEAEIDCCLPPRAAADAGLLSSARIRQLLRSIALLRRIVAHGGRLRPAQSAKMAREGPLRAELARRRFERYGPGLREEVNPAWECPNELCARDGYLLNPGACLRCRRCRLQRPALLLRSLIPIRHRHLQRSWRQVATEPLSVIIGGPVLSNLAEKMTLPILAPEIAVTFKAPACDIPLKDHRMAAFADDPVAIRKMFESVAGDVQARGQANPNDTMASVSDIPRERTSRLRPSPTNSAAIQEIFESVTEWITNDIKAPVCDIPLKDLDMVVAFASNSTTIQEMFELVADQIPNTTKASEYDIPPKDLKMAFVFPSNSTKIQEGSKLAAEWTPNNIKASVSDIPLKDLKMVVASASNSTGIQEMFEGMAEWVPNSFKASFAGNPAAIQEMRRLVAEWDLKMAAVDDDSTAIQEMFESVAEWITNNIKASVRDIPLKDLEKNIKASEYDIPLKDLKMAVAFASNSTGIQEMFEGMTEWAPSSFKASVAGNSTAIQEMFRLVAEWIPNNIKASEYNIPLKGLKMAAVDDDATATQEKFESVAEWITNNIKASGCDIPLKDLDVVVSVAGNSTAILEMFELAMWLKLVADRIPDNIKTTVSDIPLKHLKMAAAFASNSTTIQEMFESMAEWIPNSFKASFAGNSTALVAEWTPDSIKASLCNMPLRGLKMASVDDDSTAIQEMFESVVEWITNDMNSSVCDIPLKDLDMVAAFASNSTTIQEMFELVADQTPNCIKASEYNIPLKGLKMVFVFASNSTTIQEGLKLVAEWTPDNIKASVSDIPLKGLKMAVAFAIREMFEGMAEWTPKGIKAPVAGNPTAIQEMFELVAEWIPNNIKASLYKIPLKDLRMAAVGDDSTATQEKFEIVAVWTTNNIKASGCDIPLKDLDVVVSVAGNSTAIQEMFELVAEMFESVADWSPKSIKASFAGNSTAKRSKRTVPGRAWRDYLAGAALEMSRLVAEWAPNDIKMFESVVEWITNDIKASVCDIPLKDLDMVVAFASNSTTIEEMFGLVADQSPNNIKASEYNVPLKDPDMAVALASNSTTIQEMFELVADQAPNNVKASEYNVPLKDPDMVVVFASNSTTIQETFRMAASADNSTAIQEMLQHMVEWILINIKALLCDIPLEGLEMAALAKNSAEIQVMFKHVAEWISSNSTAIQEVSESMAEWIPNSIKASVCNIPLRGLVPPRPDAAKTALPVQALPELLPPLLVYDHATGEFPGYRGFWSEYYKVCLEPKGL
ncbi:unnamed protein product, partial [Prorocentrum cordatum]